MSCATCSSAKGGSPAGCRNNGHCATGGCNKLPVYSWLTGVPLAAGQQLFDAVEIRFKNTRKGFYRNAEKLTLNPGDAVIVDAAPGHDVGVVSLTGELVRVQMEKKKAGNDTFELRKVLRMATQEDLDRWHAARKLEDETLLAARTIVYGAHLAMKVTDVEYQGDGTKATFYYTAEERVDFRDLLRPLSDRFKVRVEMKQIGSRQEAGRIGGLGSCGRELCCSTWLTDFRSVTTSAARYQQLALNPQKLAGQCGKLKCCLNYELDMYIEAVKSYPSQNAKLKTAQGTGYHQKTDIFMGVMWYLFKQPGSHPAMAGFPIEKVREIIEQNKQGVEPHVNLEMIAEAEATAKAPEHDYENVVGEDDLTRFDQKIKSGKKHGGRDRHKRHGRGGGGQQGGQGGPQNQAGQGGGRRDRGRRDRGPRGPKPQGGPPAAPAS
jgi:cell fate regulator YaaT (PSP1 superfamily)